MISIIDNAADAADAAAAIGFARYSCIGSCSDDVWIVGMCLLLWFGGSTFPTHR